MLSGPCCVKGLIQMASKPSCWMYPIILVVPAHVPPQCWLGVSHFFCRHCSEANLSVSCSGHHTFAAMGSSTGWEGGQQQRTGWVSSTVLTHAGQAWPRDWRDCCGSPLTI